MKKIACELCGSNEFVKEDGMFVCQSCGTKYTVEEAKKLMIEGTVEVTGTVKVDNQAKVSNLLILARRAKETNDSKTAAQYYQQLLLEDPDNWEAAFYTIFYDAHNNKIAQIGAAANRVSNSLTSVFNQIRLLPEEKKLAAAQEVSLQCCRFADMLFSNAVDFLKNNYDVKSRDTGDVFKDLADVLERNKKRLTQANEWITPVLLMLLKLGDELEAALANNPELYCNVFVAAKQMVDSLVENKILQKSNTERGDTTAIAMNMMGCTELYAAILVVMDKQGAIENVEKQLKQKKIDAYWAEHADEKAQLTEKQTALQAELQPMQKRLDEIHRKLQALDPNQSFTVPASAEMKKLQQQKFDLNRQLSSLGLFKGKEKKALTEQIEQLNTRLQELNTQVNHQIAQKKQELKQTRQTLLDEQRELEGQKAALSNQLKEIETELTKER